MKLVYAAAATAIVSVAQPIASNAADWPTKPVTLIVPFPAGGGSDPVARLLAKGMGDRWGQRVVVEFRPGGSATIGTNTVAKAKPDGYTLLLTSNTPVVNVKWTMPDLPYDVDDVVPILKVADASIMLVANANFKANSFREMVDHAKANPGKVNLAIQGVGSFSHYVASLISIRSGTTFNIVSYKGAGDLQADLMSGVADLGVGYPTGFLSGVKAGKLKFLGTLANQRLDSLPNVKTTAEEGFPQVAAASWLIMFTPKGTPQDVVEKIVSTTNAILKEPKVRQDMENLGYATPVDGTPKQAAEALALDRKDFKEVYESGAMNEK